MASEESDEMTFPQPLEFGKRLFEGQTLDELLAGPVWSLSPALQATVGGTRATSVKAQDTIVNVGTVGVSGAAITIPTAIPGKLILVFNNSANDLRVFADDPSSIDGISGDVGILLPAQTLTLFTAQELRKWTSTTLALYVTPARHYLSAYDTTVQPNTDPTARQIMTFNSVVAASGISIVGGSKITVANTGVYNVQFSTQIDKTDSGRDSMEIWLMRNGNNESWSNTWVEADNNNAKVVAAWNFVIPLNAGDFVELAWWSADVDMRLFARPAEAVVPGVSPARPAIPSAILTVQSI